MSYLLHGSRRALLGGAGDEFLPTQISGLELWLEARAITGLNNGDPVGTWNDSSGKGRDGTASGANRPQFRSGGSPAGRASILSDGSDDVISVAHAAGIDFTGAHTLAFNLKSTQAGNKVLMEKGSNAKLVVQPDTNQVFYLHGSITVGSAVRSDTFDGTWRRVMLVYDGATAFYYLDGVERGTASVSAPSANSDPFVIFARSGGGVACAAEISDVLLYGAALTGPQRTSLDTWLRNR